MDLVSTIAACSLVEDVRLVVAMAIAFSGGHPHAMQTISQREDDTSSAYTTELSDSDSDVDTASVAKPKTSEQAEVELQRRLSDGGTVVVGLVPVPASWATEFGRQPVDLLSTCTNVSIATAKLAEFAGACKRHSRSCVLRRYAREAGLAGFEEDALEVLRDRSRLLNASSREVAVHGETSAEGGPRVEEGSWGIHQLFFTMTNQDSLDKSQSRAPVPIRRDH